MIASFGTIAAVFALLGTGSQAYVSLRQLKEFDPAAHRAFVAVDHLKAEFSSVRHPARWSHQRREVQQLLKESPQEARLYHRVQWQIGSWTLLSMASLLAVITALWG